MQKIFLVTALFTVIASMASGQCPTAAFTVPDSTCAGSGIQAVNSSTGGTQYFWDLCPGDLETVPVTADLLGFGGLNGPQQIRLIKADGNYYLFVANLSGNNILRYDFGNSTDNVPVVFDYQNLNSLFNNPGGIDVINENGNWYALVVNYSGNNLIRVDLGTVISNNTATATDLGFYSFNLPIAVKIVKENGNYHAFVSNSNNSNLIRVDMGNSITNTPTGSAILSDPNFNSGWAFDVAYDCALGKWIGFYASTALNKINILDFGNSLTNPFVLAPEIANSPYTTGITLTRDGTDWHLLTVSIGNLELQNYKIGSNLLNTPTLVPVGIIPGITSPRGISVMRDSASFTAFMSMNSASTIKMIKFQKPCFASPITSSDSVSISPVFTINNAYNEIVLEVTGPNGQVAVYSDSIYVQEAPQTGFIHSLSCEGFPVQFTDTSILNTSLVTEWLWDFGDLSPTSNLQNPVHIFPANGTYAVSLTASYVGGCSTTFTDSVTVSPLPLADFTFPNNQCSEIPVQFTDASQAFAGGTIVSWLWDFGDGSLPDSIQNPQHSFTNAITHTVTLIVIANTGCSDTVTQTITILPAPVAGYTVESTCVGETVSFTNTTTIQGSGTLTYDWDFGDTSTSILTDPTHSYAPSTGSYLVTMIAMSANGCQDTITDSLRISNQPVPQFSWSPLVVCEFNDVSFTSTSFGNGDTILAYIWDFGDSTYSNDENPFHAYADTGFYDVTLTVVSPTACDSSITLQLYVIPSPTASFTATDVCFGLATSFNPSTTTPPTTQVDSIVWTFGDGNGFTGLTSPFYTYNTPGRYEVTMTVYNDLLCTASFVDSIDVYPLPVADFTTSILCSDSLVTFDGTLSQVPNDSITSWTWDFAGLGNGSGDTAFFAFPDSGNFTVTLIATTLHGCQDTSEQLLNIIQSPEFDFTFNESCLGEPSNFTFLPFITTPSILSWDFGDSSGSVILNPTHTYAYIDTFNVTLRVEHNATGCASSLTKQLDIKPFPDPGFTFNDNCEGIPVQFNDTSTITTGNIASWNWNFGVLGNSADQNPEITPADPGSYPLTLTVTSDEGCVSEISDTLITFTNPVAAFTPDPLYGSPPLLVNFGNNSSGGVLFNWNYGDGNTGTGINPSHIFQDTGFYNVTLVATSAEGCLDSTNVSLSVLIPYLDIAINKIYASQNNQFLKLITEIANMGNIPVSTFKISGIIENGSTINETWNGMLLPGNSIIYEFTASYDLNSRTIPGYYCAEALFPNNQTDANSLNNNKCAVIGSEFEIYTAFPNPFNDEVSISFNLPFEDIFDIQVYDISGKLVYDQLNSTGIKGYNKILIPTANYAKGIYAITVQYRDVVKVIKVMNR